VEDCVVCHQCLGMGDVPPACFSDDAALFRTVDALETHSRAFAFDYFKAQSMEAFYNYSAMYYGYYFRVLLDRMDAIIDGSPSAIPLSIQVFSDSNITPLLKMLQLDAFAKFRPGMNLLLLFCCCSFKFKKKKHIY
jgi:hypothetical protein